MLQGVLGGKTVKIKVLLSQGLLEEKHPFPNGSFLATKLKTNLTSKGQTNKQSPIKPPKWLLLFHCLFKLSPHPTASLPPRIAFCCTPRISQEQPGTGSTDIGTSLAQWAFPSCALWNTGWIFCVVSGTCTYSLCFHSHYRNRPGRLTPKSRKSNFDGFCSERCFLSKWEHFLFRCMFTTGLKSYSSMISTDSKWHYDFLLSRSLFCFARNPDLFIL